MLKIRVTTPYLVVKQGTEKNQVKDLNGEVGKIIDFKVDGAILAEFDNEMYIIPRDAYKVCLK